MSSFIWPSQGGSGGVPVYSTLSAFPVTATVGDLGVAADTGNLYEWNGSTWNLIGGPGAMLSIGTIDSMTPSANGAVDYTNQLILQSASATVPGLVNTTAQTFAGTKTFNSILAATDNTYNIGVGTGSNRFANATFGTSVVAGVYPFVSFSGSAGIAVTPGFIQFFNGSAELTGLRLGAASGLDIYIPGTGVSTLANAYSSTTFKDGLLGTTYLTASASVLTSAGVLSASNFSGSSSGTNTGDVTLGTASGLSLAGQVLSLQLSSGSLTGALSSTDWTTFNNKQAALTIGNLTDAGTDGITVTGGTGAVIGSGASLSQHVADTTHNGYLSSTDWNTFNGKQASGNYITALTGDVTASGPGSVAATSAATQNNITSIPNLATVGTVTSGTWSATTVAINKGGTGVTSVTASAAASSWAGWDANKNFSANNILENYTTTATAAGTTTLTVASSAQQYFTGSTTQTVKLPVATTLVNGLTFEISNLSSGVVTVQTSGLNTVQAMGTNTVIVITCINTAGGTGTASWSWTYAQSGASLPLTNPMTTGGDVIYGGASGVPTRLANGTAGQALVSAGTTLAPVWTTLKAPTNQLFTATGTTSGYLFPVSGISVAPTAGATYTNNANTFTVLGITNSNTLLWCSCGSSATISGTTLTKASGTGDATITFVNTATTTNGGAQPLATYTTPAGAAWLKVTCQGLGGGGGGTATAAGAAGAAGGGGGGACTVKWIASPAASYFYCCFGSGGAGGASGANAGIGGKVAAFGSGSTFYVGAGGVGGGASGTSSVPAFGGNYGAGGAAQTNGDMNFAGGDGFAGFILSATGAGAGVGGSSVFAGATGGGVNTSAAGTLGKNYGSGGSGGVQINNAGAQAGGQGAIGFVLVEEFYQ